MGEKTTLTVSDGTLARFKQLKSELDEVQNDCPDHTNESFLQALMDTWEAADDGYYDDTPQGFVNIAEATEAELDELATEIRRLREQVERVPEDTAEIVGRKHA